MIIWMINANFCSLGFFHIFHNAVNNIKTHNTNACYIPESWNDFWKWFKCSFYRLWYLWEFFLKNRKKLSQKYSSNNHIAILGFGSIHCGRAQSGLSQYYESPDWPLPECVYTLSGQVSLPIACFME